MSYHLMYIDRACESTKARTAAAATNLGGDDKDNVLSVPQVWRVQQSQVANSMRSCVDHPLWSDGLGIASYHHALRPLAIAWVDF
jgi:hypothetical protein